jgi:hypothetical protein
MSLVPTDEGSIEWEQLIIMIQVLWKKEIDAETPETKIKTE